MKTFFMYKNHDFNFEQKLPLNEQVLSQDLELDTLFNAMSAGDEFIFEVVKKVVFLGLHNNIDEILYRQNILKDCLKNSSIVRDIYQITVESIENDKRKWISFYLRNNNSPSSILRNSIELLEIFVDMLKKIKNIASKYENNFESEGFKAFFSRIKKELDDDFFNNVQKHLKNLKFRDGVLLSVELGKGNEGTNYMLRKPKDKKRNWIKRIFAQKHAVYTFYLADRDENGARMLSELQDMGNNLVANAVAQSADHIDSFLKTLRTELAYYIGCLNLHEQLSQIGEPISFPIPVTFNDHKHSFKGLYDICLSLTMKQKVVGNDVNVDNKDLIIITGANQGGKSTFLRSIGVAQMMMQCGMFVPAEFFCANICDNLFTHYKRKEDASLKSGKLDEELSRMSNIIDNISLNSIILFNESFASTNEREGSEIARQIIYSLFKKRIKVFFVTHLYEFTYGFYKKKLKNVAFLQAERLTDGKRTFKIIQGTLLQTSYGKDLYKRIFKKEN